MKRSILAVLFCVLGLMMAGDAQQKQASPKVKVALKWVESITWSPDTAGGELSWVVAEGERGPEGQMVKTVTQHYKISPGDCIMSYNGEKRGFEREEGEQVVALLRLLYVYTVQSSIWWEQGRGYPVDKDGKPILPTPPSMKQSTPEKNVPALKVRALLGPHPSAF